VLQYVHAAFKLFGARRIMFGSDWPVCGVGPGTNFGHQPGRVGMFIADGDEEQQGKDKQRESVNREPGRTAWTEWRDVVEKLLEACELSQEETEWIWWRTAAKAYGLDLDLHVDDE